MLNMKNLNKFHINFFVYLCFLLEIEFDCFVFFSKMEFFQKKIKFEKTKKLIFSLKK